LAPKSNAVIRAIGAASDDIRSGHSGPVPAHLRDTSYRGAARLGHGKGYLYPHDFAEGIVRQDYLPEAAAGHRYYEPSRHGAEARYADRLERIRSMLDGAAADSDHPDGDGGRDG
jgi:putative ATPase